LTTSSWAENNDSGRCPLQHRRSSLRKKKKKRKLIAISTASTETIFVDEGQDGKEERYRLIAGEKFRHQASIPPHGTRIG